MEEEQVKEVMQLKERLTYIIENKELTIHVEGGPEWLSVQVMGKEEAREFVQDKVDYLHTYPKVIKCDECQRVLTGNKVYCFKCEKTFCQTCKQGHDLLCVLQSLLPDCRPVPMAGGKVKCNTPQKAKPKTFVGVGACSGYLSVRMVCQTCPECTNPKRSLKTCVRRAR